MREFAVGRMEKEWGDPIMYISTFKYREEDLYLDLRPQPELLKAIHLTSLYWKGKLVEMLMAEVMARLHLFPRSVANCLTLSEMKQLKYNAASICRQLKVPYPEPAKFSGLPLAL